MKSLLLQSMGPMISNISYDMDIDEPDQEATSPTARMEGVEEEAIDNQGMKRWQGMRDLQIYRDYRFQRENVGRAGYGTSKRMRVSFTIPEGDVEIKPILMTEGPLKGKRVLVLEEMSFNLMDLSPELRVMIFKNLLVRSSKIVIGRPRDQKVLVNGTWRLSRGWIGHYETLVDKRLTGFNLMLVSKTIREEAAEVVYGHNVFDLRGSRAAMQFLQDIGSMTYFLRHVILTNVDPKSGGGRELFRNLALFPRQMRTIHLSYTILMKSKQVEDDFGPVAEAIAEETWGTGLEGLGRLLKSQGCTVDEVASLIKVHPKRHNLCAFCLDELIGTENLQSGDKRRCSRGMSWCNNHFGRCEEIEAAIELKMVSLFDDDT